MELIDDTGRLFGVVNVIDALVVLLVVAVLAAGVAFITAPNDENPNQAVRYVTVEVGPENPEAVQAFGGGETTLGKADAEHVGTYVAPAGNGSLSAMLALRVQGDMQDGEFVAGNAHLRPGQGVSLQSSTSVLGGEIVSVTAEQPEPTETTVTLASDLPPEIATEIEAGDTLTRGGETVVRVESISREERESGPTSVRVTATVTTIQTDAGLRYGKTILRLGTGVTVATDDYEFKGVVVGIDR
jgi:hypothetical protein